jgi:hypothetical protein
MFIGVWMCDTPARISICLANGLIGEARYALISKGDTGNRDLTVSGKKRGRTSSTSNPFAVRKSAILV